LSLHSLKATNRSTNRVRERVNCTEQFRIVKNAFLLFLCFFLNILSHSGCQLQDRLHNERLKEAMSSVCTVGRKTKTTVLVTSQRAIFGISEPEEKFSN
jgi:hypothetical protein